MLFIFAFGLFLMYNKNRLLNNYLKYFMAKRATALIAHVKSKHSPKTKKRLEAKKVMLAAKNDKKKSVAKRKA